MSSMNENAKSHFLQLHNVVKRFGENAVVQGIDLSIHEGEFISLLGPSGCGKTTTLQMIAGFEAPTSGQLWLASREITHVPANRREIGVVFQNYALFPHMTVAQNITFGLDLRKMDANAKQRRLQSLVELVALGGLEERFPRQLSGGQQQRVAIARALAVEPRLLLLDEPFSNLDARMRGGMQAEVKRLQKETGITTILVTHDQSEAMALSDRVAIMRHGKVLQVDTPQDAYDRPTNAYVGTFLGNTNLLQLKIVSREANFAHVTIDGRTVQVVAPIAHANGSCTVSLRPERIHLHGSDGDISLRGRVVAREFLGAGWTIAAETSLGRVTLNTPHNGRNVPAEGEHVALYWAHADMRTIHVD